MIPKSGRRFSDKIMLKLCASEPVLALEAVDLLGDLRGQGTQSLRAGG
jgi:hypothetical protein